MLLGPLLVVVIINELGERGGVPKTYKNEERAREKYTKFKRNHNVHKD